MTLLAFFMSVFYLKCGNGRFRGLEDVCTQIRMSPGRDREAQRVTRVIGKGKVVIFFFFYIFHGCFLFWLCKRRTKMS